MYNQRAFKKFFIFTIKYDSTVLYIKFLIDELNFMYLLIN